MTRNPRLAWWLNLFVLPGAGQWYLGARRLGSGIAALSIVALCYPLLRFVRAVESQMPDAMDVAARESTTLFTVLHGAWRVEHIWLCAGLVVVLACWAAALIDLWRRQPHAD